MAQVVELQAAAFVSALTVPLERLCFFTEHEVQHALHGNEPQSQASSKTLCKGLPNELPSSVSIQCHVQRT